MPGLSKPRAPVAASAPRARLIAIEGAIGAGKTSLARRLAAHLGAELLLEQPDDNPFLARFYAEGARHALATQLCFLFQRIDQFRDLAQPDLFQSGTVADFLFDKDPLFARLTLSDDELQLYERIYATLKPQAPLPDLVVFLQAPVSVLQARIERRSRPYERSLTEGTGVRYLGSLVDAYNRFFHNYEEAPVFIVNCEHLNLADNDVHFQLLVDRMTQMRGMREYLNAEDI